MKLMNGTVHQAAPLRGKPTFHSMEQREVSCGMDEMAERVAAFSLLISGLWALAPLCRKGIPLHQLS